MARSTHETRFLLTAKDKTKAALKSAKMNLKGVDGAVSSLQGSLLGLAGAGGLGLLVSGVIDTNREFQSLRASLKSVTGSLEEGEKAFQQILDLAVETPFAVRELTEAYNVLTGRGLKPTVESMRDYGNIAAATNKTIDQVVQAVADAASGQFRRLEDFGIAASKQGEQVEFTFKGISTTVANNSEAILGYFQQLSKQNFGTAMDDQMNTLGGAFSNFGDAMDALFLKIGEAGLNDLVIDITRSITGFVDSFGPEQQHTITQFFKNINDGFGSIAHVINAISWLQGNGMLEQWERNNPSQIGGLSPGVQGGYSLGDFNRSGGSLSELRQLRDIESRTPKEQLDAMKENNKYQQQILDAIRENNSVAVAG